MRRIAIYCPTKATSQVCWVITEEHGGWTRNSCVGSWHGEEEGIDYIWSYGESVGTILKRVKEELYWAGEKTIAYELDGQFFVEDLTKPGKFDNAPTEAVE